ncbi:hypothetical protein LOAG_02343 [Loa loa]|uniref:Uncharacterized protein n=1 Tax=Loa loa TaxID=7209 RepID=A0A1S0U6X7_LOALO|nr:hypothetical protein LOAG_02343 [Loa loa]EFO26139.1 hypothetical protein LOAG_02343 [Loa loa]
MKSGSKHIKDEFYNFMQMKKKVPALLQSSMRQLINVIFVVCSLTLSQTIIFSGDQTLKTFGACESHSKCMMKMKYGDKTALVDIAIAIRPGSNQISVAFGKKCIRHDTNTL